MTAPFDLVSFANGLLASQRSPVKCGGCSSPATRRDADDVADVCDYCGEASDDQKLDREKRMRLAAERGGDLMKRYAPEKGVTLGEVTSRKETGIAVGHQNGKVCIFRLCDGVQEWGEELEPDDADDIATMIHEEAAKARSQAVS